MAIRFYLLPLERIGNGRGPKYLVWRYNESGIVPIRWSLYDYGMIDVCLVMADVTTAQHNSLISNADVTAIPANIDSNVTAQTLPAVRAALESLRIPGNWVTTAFTYREILRVVGGLFQFARRHHFLHKQVIIPDNINIDQTWADLPIGWRQNLAITADSFGYDYSQVTVNTPIRTILKHLADSWGDTPLLIGGTEI